CAAAAVVRDRDGDDGAAGDAVAGPEGQRGSGVRAAVAVLRRGQRTGGRDAHTQALRFVGGPWADAGERDDVARVAVAGVGGEVADGTKRGRIVHRVDRE